MILHYISLVRLLMEHFLWLTSFCFSLSYEGVQRLAQIELGKLGKSTYSSLWSSLLLKSSSVVSEGCINWQVRKICVGIIALHSIITSPSKAAGTFQHKVIVSLYHVIFSPLSCTEEHLRQVHYGGCCSWTLGSPWEKGKDPGEVLRYWGLHVSQSLQDFLRILRACGLK